MKMQVGSWGTEVNTHEENQDFHGYLSLRKFTHRLRIVGNAEMNLHLDS